jgi:hypothetical protein
MTRLACLAWFSFALAGTACSVSGADWFFAPSTYSHSLQTGERVNQFASIPPVYSHERPDYLRSGLRQTRSVIRTGRSLDVYHTVDRYGEEIRPYGEWLYPYRPYAVPYPAWGPPYGGFNGDFSADIFRQGVPRDFHRRHGSFGATGPLDSEFAPEVFDGGEFHDRRRNDDFNSRSRVREQIHGLFDGRGIPGDDEHYLDQPRRLEELDDREFFSRPQNGID